jgi:hypothetical protein
MSHKPVTSRKLRSHIDKNAPNTSSIDEFKAEEFPSSDLGILAEFQGGNESTSTAGGVQGLGSDAPNTTSSTDESKAEEFVSSADFLGILAEFQGGNESTSTPGGVEGLSSNQLFCQPCDEDENVEVVAEGKTNSRSKKRKRGMTMENYDEYVDDNDENADSWNGDGNGATWHLCKDCDYKAKRKDHLKRHRANIHNKNVTWQYCKDCDFKAKQKGSLKIHRANIHNKNVTWHYCKDCDYKAKRKDSLKRHRANIHNENVTWQYCKDCDYKAKHKGEIKKHRARIHDVTWYTCPQHGCGFKAKERSDMKKHVYSHQEEGGASQHDLGDVFLP